MPDHDWTDRLRGLMPFADVLDLEVVSAAAREVVGQARWAAERCTVNGMLHGGVLMASADSIAALCAQLNLPDGATGTSTIEAKTNFFAAVRNGVITITATPLHVGRSTVVVQTDVHRDDGRRVSRTLQTQSVLT
jgi:1,4-dihydroxy-2-naphthoyl-CoA hydrolase